MRIYKGDIFFALLLAYFLSWGYALGMADYSWLNVGRLLMHFLFLAAMLGLLLTLVSYLRGKPLMGRAKSAYFSWGRVLPVSIFLSAAYVLFFWLMLPKPLENRHWWTLLILFIGGCLALLLYFYGLVQKTDDK